MTPLGDPIEIPCMYCDGTGVMGRAQAYVATEAELDATPETAVTGFAFMLTNPEWAVAVEAAKAEGFDDVQDWVELLVQTELMRFSFFRGY